MRVMTKGLRGCLLPLVVSACGCGTGCPKAPEPAAAPEPPSQSCVDGERALAHVRHIVELGPRPPGSEALSNTRDYIEAQLTGFGLTPRRHPFTAYTPHPRQSQVAMENLTVDIPGTGPGKVLLGGHFDGKLLDGLDFRGANDGGSSTALLLEIGRCLAASPPPCGVTLAFLDGEEALVDWSDRDSLYGSKNLAAELKSSGALAEVRAAVIVDMIGDADLHLYKETLSTAWVASALFDAARATGHAALFDGPRASIEDDHLPFLQSGVPAAVLIDLTFGPGNSYWHTEEDTVDKLSPASMQAVGEVVQSALPRLCAGATQSR